MQKLDEIPKTNIFQVPDGYFDRLPMQIQNRVEMDRPQGPSPVWSLALRYALPVIIVGFALVYLLQPKATVTEDALYGVSNEHLIAFLNESDISENDLLEVANFNDTDADSLTQQLNNTLLGDFDPDNPDSYRGDELKSVFENEL